MSCFVTIVGNVGQDPQSIQGQRGNAASFSVGVSFGGGQNKTTEWFDCTAWSDKQAESILQYVSKGMRITVLGDLTFQEYQGKQQKKVKIHRYHTMGGSQPQQGQQQGQQQGRQPGGYQYQTPPQGYANQPPPQGYQQYNQAPQGQYQQGPPQYQQPNQGQQYADPGFAPPQQPGGAPPAMVPPDAHTPF